MATKVRRAAVAGTFYAGSAPALRAQIEGCFLHPLGVGALPSVAPGWDQRLVALICPHAGYIYSGPIAAHSYATLAQHGKPERLVLLGPNHYGLGQALALSPDEAWETPLGLVAVDRELGERVKGVAQEVAEDSLPHLQEHSLEVQVPFLQYLYGEAFRFLPLSLRDQRLSTCGALGEGLGKLLLGEQALIIASTDFSHYDPHEVTVAKDRYAVAAIQAGDAAALERVLLEHDVTMCGPGAVMATLVAAKALGATTVRLLGYATSGDTSGNRQQVVGYGAFALLR